MIKILYEEPITYQQNYDAVDISAWVYKNPTKKEMNDILYSVKRNIYSLRALLKGNDCYFCDGYYYVHSQMASVLRKYTGLYLNDYDLGVTIHLRENAIYFAEQSKTFKNGKIDGEDFYILKRFIPEFLKLGLVNGDTKIANYVTGITDFTVAELMNGKYI